MNANKTICLSLMLLLVLSNLYGQRTLVLDRNGKQFGKGSVILNEETGIHPLPETLKIEDAKRLVKLVVLDKQSSPLSIVSYGVSIVDSPKVQKFSCDSSSFTFDLLNALKNLKRGTRIYFSNIDAKLDGGLVFSNELIFIVE